MRNLTVLFRYFGFKGIGIIWRRFPNRNMVHCIFRPLNMNPLNWGPTLFSKQLQYFNKGEKIRKHFTRKVFAIWIVVFSEFNMNGWHFLWEIQRFFIARNKSFRRTATLVCCRDLKIRNSAFRFCEILMWTASHLLLFTVIRKQIFNLITSSKKQIHHFCGHLWHLMHGTGFVDSILGNVILNMLYHFNNYFLILNSCITKAFA